LSSDEDRPARPSGVPPRRAESPPAAVDPAPTQPKAAGHPHRRGPGRRVRSTPRACPTTPDPVLSRIQVTPRGAPFALSSPL